MNPFSAEIRRLNINSIFFTEAVIGVASPYNEATPPVIACLLLPTNSPDDAVCRPLREKLLVAVFRWRNQLYRNPSHYRLQQLLPRYVPEKENIVRIKYFPASFKFVDRSIDGSFVNLFIGSVHSFGRSFIYFINSILTKATLCSLATAAATGGAGALVRTDTLHITGFFSSSSEPSVSRSSDEV